MTLIEKHVLLETPWSRRNAAGTRFEGARDRAGASGKRAQRLVTYAKKTKEEKEAAKAEKKAAALETEKAEAAQLKKEAFAGEGPVKGLVKRLLNPKPVPEKEITYAQMLEYLQTKRVVRLAVYDDGLEAIGTPPIQSGIPCKRLGVGSCETHTAVTDAAPLLTATTRVLCAHMGFGLAVPGVGLELDGQGVVVAVVHSGGVHCRVRGRAHGDDGAGNLQLHAPR